MSSGQLRCHDWQRYLLMTSATAVTQQSLLNSNPAIMSCDLSTPHQLLDQIAFESWILDWSMLPARSATGRF